MDNQRQRHRVETETSDPVDHSPADPGGTNLQNQAAAFGDAARRARQGCQQKQDAVQELQKRRNRPGQ